MKYSKKYNFTDSKALSKIKVSILLMRLITIRLLFTSSAKTEKVDGFFGCESDRFELSSLM